MQSSASRTWRFALASGAMARLMLVPRRESAHFGSHMFVFTRRAVQQMLDDIAPWMPERPLRDLLGRLNEARTNRLPQMWELAWLYALGAALPVEHEHALPNGKPDLSFSVSDGDRLVPVVADITTLSDAALHKANPFERLIGAVHQHASKVGIQRGGFHVAVSHLEAGKSGTKKVQLLIPTGSEFEEINRRFIAPFVRSVATDPTAQNMLDVDEPEAKFTIEYKGLNQISSGSYRVYDSILSLENNVLFNRLAAKTHQLRGASAGTVRMLVVCDGDCALLRRGRPQEGFSAQQVAEHFLRGSQTIDLVLLVTVCKESTSNFSQRDH
jgi:hypothetical protein